MVEGAMTAPARRSIAREAPFWRKVRDSNPRRCDPGHRFRDGRNTDSANLPHYELRKYRHKDSNLDLRVLSATPLPVGLWRQKNPYARRDSNPHLRLLGPVPLPIGLRASEAATRCRPGPPALRGRGHKPCAAAELPGKDSNLDHAGQGRISCRWTTREGLQAPPPGFEPGASRSASGRSLH